MKSASSPVVRRYWVHDSSAAFECLVRRRRVRGVNVPDVNINGALTASIACSPDELRAAAALVEARYAERGYRVSGAADDEPDSSVTLIARENNVIVGTLTVKFDGPQGLGADETYGDAVDAVRRAGGDVCELTRLAVEPSVDSRSVLSVLFGLAYVVGRGLRGVTDVFVEVNPRHVAFYRRLFGFGIAAGRRICPRVMAPAVLLRLEIERLEARLAESGILTRSALGPDAELALAA